MSPAEAGRQIAASEKKARDAAKIGSVFASYIPRRGCFIGVITKTNKTEFVVKTRGGNVVKLPYAYALDQEGFKYTYAEWDAIAAQNVDVAIIP